MSNFPLKNISLPDFEDLSLTTVNIGDSHTLVGVHDCFAIKDSPNYLKWIAFAQGKKDLWCVYLCENISHNDPTLEERYCFIPKDTYYFERINWLGTLSAYGITPEMLYGHFYYIYTLCCHYKKSVSLNVIETINAIVNQYYAPYNKIADFDFADFVREQFMLVYAAMVAEEFYVRGDGTPTLFGPLIKMLALHRILMEHKPYKEIASCYNCVKADDIRNEAIRLGIVRL